MHDNWAHRIGQAGRRTIDMNSYRFLHTQKNTQYKNRICLKQNPEQTRASGDGKANNGSFEAAGFSLELAGCCCLASSVSCDIGISRPIKVDQFREDSGPLPVRAAGLDRGNEETKLQPRQRLLQSTTGAVPARSRQLLKTSLRPQRT